MSNSGLGYQDQALQGLLNAKVVEAREFTLVNTTSSTAITAVGSATITVASATNIAVDQNLTIDSGTSQETVLVTAVSGTSVTAYFTKSHSPGYTVVAKVLRQPCIIADPTSQSAMAGVTAKGVQQSFSMQTNEITNTGRALMTFTADVATVGTTAESLVSCTKTLNLTPTTGQTQYTVSAGKTLRIQGIIITINDTTSGIGAANLGTTIRMRAAASGTITTSSTLLASIQVGPVGASLGAGNTTSLAGEMQLESGTVFGFTRADSAASAVVLSLTVIGYEF